MEKKIFTPIFEVTDKKRNYIIKSSIIIIVLLAIIAITLIIAYNKSNKIEYIKYNESSSVDYKVYLKSNDYFEKKYLSTDKKYIASLIKNIQADFKYDLDMLEGTSDYVYSYNIDATVNVIDKDDKRVIYTDTKNMVERNALSNKINQNIDIEEKVKIDYNKYNNLISKFVDTYDLNNVESTLFVNMYIKLARDERDLANAKITQVASLEIPLTTKTVGIEMVSNAEKGLKNDLFIKTKNGKLFLIFIALLILGVDIVYAVILVRFYMNTRTDQNIFEGKLSRIINTYRGYIQKVDSEEINFGEYQSVYVNSFSDLLEIRDTLQEPILMIENKTNTEVHFLIPSQTKIIYIFLLGTDKEKKRLTDGNKVENRVN